MCDAPTSHFVFPRNPVGPNWAADRTQTPNQRSSSSLMTKLVPRVVGKMDGNWGTKVSREEGGGGVSAWRCLRGGSGLEELGRQKAFGQISVFTAVQFCVPDAMPSLPLLSKGAAAVIFMRGVLQPDLMA